MGEKHWKARQGEVKSPKVDCSHSLCRKKSVSIKKLTKLRFLESRGSTVLYLHLCMPCLLLTDYCITCVHTCTLPYSKLWFVCSLVETRARWSPICTTTWLWPFFLPTHTYPQQRGGGVRTLVSSLLSKVGDWETRDPVFSSVIQSSGICHFYEVAHFLSRK